MALSGTFSLALDPRLTRGTNDDEKGMITPQATHGAASGSARPASARVSLGDVTGCLGCHPIWESKAGLGKVHLCFAEEAITRTHFLLDPPVRRLTSGRPTEDRRNCCSLRSPAVQSKKTRWRKASRVICERRDGVAWPWLGCKPVSCQVTWQRENCNKQSHRRPLDSLKGQPWHRSKLTSHHWHAHCH